MAGQTTIEWCDASWNVVRGCSPVGEGCRNCYAARWAIRQAANGKAYAGLVRSTPNGPQWTGRVEFVSSLLDWPLRRRKPSVIFVDSMSDLFHPKMSDRDIGRVFAMMAEADWHTYIVLTKRAERMRNWSAAVCHYPHGDRMQKARIGWSLNVWLGVSCWDQESADRMIPILLNTPAAHRFVSFEPLLGRVDARAFLGLIPGHPGLSFHGGRWGSVPALDAAIVGGEAGPKARPCAVEWVESIVRQCDAAGVPAFVKQLGARPGTINRLGTFIGWRDGSHGPWLRNRKGADPSEWPESIRHARRLAWRQP